MKIMEHTPLILKNMIVRYEAWNCCNFTIMNFSNINEVKIQEGVAIINIWAIKTVSK